MDNTREGAMFCDTLCVTNEIFSTSSDISRQFSAGQIDEFKCETYFHIEKFVMCLNLFFFLFFSLDDYYLIHINPEIVTIYVFTAAYF